MEVLLAWRFPGRGRDEGRRPLEGDVDPLPRQRRDARLGGRAAHQRGRIPASPKDLSRHGRTVRARWTRRHEPAGRGPRCAPGVLRSSNTAATQAGPAADLLAVHPLRRAPHAPSARPGQMWCRSCAPSSESTRSPSTGRRSTRSGSCAIIATCACRTNGTPRRGSSRWGPQRALAQRSEVGPGPECRPPI